MSSRSTHASKKLVLPTRRDVLGASAAGVAALGLPTIAPAFLRRRPSDDELRIAVVGSGRRGLDHIWALGCKDPESQLAKRKNAATTHEPIPDTRVVAVCDTYDPNLEEGARQVRATFGECGTYVDYRELLDKEDVDIVVIATPDHMHTPIALAAIAKGADVYVEKAISSDLAETLALERALEESGRLLQAGFQHREDHIYNQARKVIQNGYIGDVHMVQVFLHRAGEIGAWIFPEEKDGGPPRETVHWEEFLGVAPQREYDPHRYFGWRRYWDYSTGISGDMLTHVADGMDHLIGLGIPDAVVASGGIYHWKENRETPDTFSALLEFAGKGTQVVFQAILCNSFSEQSTRILGTEGTLSLDWRLRVYADRGSTKYAKQIRAGTINPDVPFIDLEDTAAGMDVHAAPSQLWLGGRGATLTTRPDGAIRDTTRLHHENFVACVRSREQPDSCFESALPGTLAAHMATVAYREQRRVVWDPEKRAFL